MNIQQLVYLVTTDGSITGIRRDEYVEAEERVINELKAINKPFIMVLNTRNTGSAEVKELKVNWKKNMTFQFKLWM